MEVDIKIEFETDNEQFKQVLDKHFGHFKQRDGTGAEVNVYDYLILTNISMKQMR